MALEYLNEVTEEELAEQGVVSAPNILTGTPTENKLIFDRLVAHLIAPKVNEVVRKANALIDAEEIREGQEAERKTAEEARIEAELLRAAAEQARAQAETERNGVEGQRVAAETLRDTAEADRVAAERAREAAEALRVSETDGVVARAEAEVAQASAAAEAAQTASAIASEEAVRAEAAAKAADQARIEAEAVAAGDFSLMMRRHNEDPNAHGKKFWVIRVRARDPSKPDYGLGGGGDDGGDETPVLRVKGYTGTAEVSAVVSGVEYDADNMSTQGEDVPNGTLILRKVEE